MIRLRPAWLLLTFAAACSGALDATDDDRNADDDPASDSNDPPSDDQRPPPEIVDSELCQQVNPGEAPLRRLSNAEYINTINDLLGSRIKDQLSVITDGFVPETESLGFRNSARFLAVPTVVAENYLIAAEQLAALAAADKTVIDCPNNDTACAKAFVRDFGAKAYRRPLDEGEAQRYDQLFTTVSGKYDFAAGVEAVLLAMMQSPHFLYRVETGRPAEGEVYTKPTAYETASRLSYLFWQSMPDEALFEAAANGELETPEQIREQAARLLEDPKAERVLEFYRQWLDADYLTQFQRDKDVYPNLNPELPALFAREFDTFVKHILFEANGSFEDLLTADFTFANSTLAFHYKIDGANGTFGRISRPEASGVLTQPAFLIVHDKPTRTSIVGRGVKLRTDMLCHIVPAPPANVEINLEATGEDLSQRDRLAQHREDPACAGCHALIDPLGVVFENFDAVGRVRTVDEQDAAIDTSSEISSTEDIDGPVSDPRELGHKFAASAEVQGCFVSQAFRFFYGRDHEDADDCARARLTKSFNESGHDLKELLLALTQTDTFLYRPVHAEEN